MQNDLRGLPIEEALANLYDNGWLKVQVSFTRPEPWKPAVELRVVNVRVLGDGEFELVVAGVDPDPKGE